MIICTQNIPKLFPSLAQAPAAMNQETTQPTADTQKQQTQGKGLTNIHKTSKAKTNEVL